MKIKKARIVINPSAGKHLPVLAILNEALKEAEFDWEITVSKGKKDAKRLVEDAIAAGVDAIAVCGGDGTVSAVCPALLETEIPLFILPGGSANIMANELGIPKDLKEAAELFSSGKLEVRQVDVAKFNRGYCMVRTGLGFEAEMVDKAKNKRKKKLGVFAYFFSAAEAVKKADKARYEIKIDGNEYNVDGWTCVVTNAGNLGFSKVAIDKRIDVSDGKWDVLVVRKANLNFVKHVMKTFIHRERPDEYELVEHWQGADIQVKTTPKQLVQTDGDALGEVPFHLKVIPQAIRVLAPLKRPAAGD